MVELDIIASLDCALRLVLGRVSCTSIPLERFEAALNLPAEDLVVRKSGEGVTNTNAEVSRRPARTFAMSTTPLASRNPKCFIIGIERPLWEPSSSGAAATRKGRVARRAGEKYISKRSDLGNSSPLFVEKSLCNVAGYGFLIASYKPRTNIHYA